MREQFRIAAPLVLMYVYIKTSGTGQHASLFWITIYGIQGAPACPHPYFGTPITLLCAWGQVVYILLGPILMIKRKPNHPSGFWRICRERMT
jgi:hypothetical protein